MHQSVGVRERLQPVSDPSTDQRNARRQSKASRILSAVQEELASSRASQIIRQIFIPVFLNGLL